MVATSESEAAVIQEIDVLRKYGLRWAVLAAWRDALELRHVQLSPDTDRALDKARIKLASGCFSTCDIGCDLSTVEGALTSADASSKHNWVDFWLDILQHSMSEGGETERILKIPAVKTRYESCGIKGCSCAS